jgi:hypothetical protein
MILANPRLSGGGSIRKRERRPPANCPPPFSPPSCAATSLPPTHQPRGSRRPIYRARWRRRGRHPSSRARRRRSSRTAGTRCHPSSRGTSTRRPPGTRYARWRPTRLLPPPRAGAIAARASCDLACLGFARTDCWTRCTGSGRCWGSCAACSGAPSPSSAPSGSRCEFPQTPVRLLKLQSIAFRQSDADFSICCWFGEG